MSKTADKIDAAKTAHIDKALGERLRHFRQALGLKRPQVAAALDVSVSRIQHYEEGARIPASRLWQFCGRYGVDVSEFFLGLPHHIGSQVAQAETAFAKEGRDPPPGPGRPAAGVVGELDEATPFEVDETAMAIGAAVLKLNPVERSVILRAVRGVGIKTRDPA